MNWRTSVVFVLTLTFLGCAKDGRKAELLGQSIEPDITGVWKGNLTLNNVASQLELDLKQDNINVNGTYSAVDANLGMEGQITGATTGPTFAFKFQIQNGTCVPTLQAGGQNDGTSLAFNVIGTDCQGGTLRGQATLLKS